MHFLVHFTNLYLQVQVKCIRTYISKPNLNTIDFLNDELINFGLNKCVPHNTKFLFSVIIYF